MTGFEQPKPFQLDIWQTFECQHCNQNSLVPNSDWIETCLRINPMNDNSHSRADSLELLLTQWTNDSIPRFHKCTNSACGQSPWIAARTHWAATSSLLAIHVIWPRNDTQESRFGDTAECHSFVIPEHLSVQQNLGRTLDGKSPWELFGIICRIGSRTIEEGHYVVILRARCTSGWCIINDEKVTRASNPMDCFRNGRYPVALFYAVPTSNESKSDRSSTNKEILDEMHRRLKAATRAERNKVVLVSSEQPGANSIRPWLVQQTEKLKDGGDHTTWLKSPYTRRYSNWSTILRKLSSLDEWWTD